MVQTSSQNNWSLRSWAYLPLGKLGTFPHAALRPFNLLGNVSSEKQVHGSIHGKDSPPALRLFMTSIGNVLRKKQPESCGTTALRYYGCGMQCILSCTRNICQTAQRMRNHRDLMYHRDLMCATTRPDDGHVKLLLPILHIFVYANNYCLRNIPKDSVSFIMFRRLINRLYNFTRDFGPVVSF